MDDVETTHALDPIDLGVAGITVSSGDHVGHYYQSWGEAEAIVAGFLSTGLRANEKCVYICPADRSGSVLDALSAQGIDVEGALRSGGLIVEEGRPTPDGMKALLLQALEEVPSRYPLLRWAGEMSWSVDQLSDSESLMEWETMCNVIDAPRAVFLCQYDIRRFSGAVIIDALKSHPLSIVGETIHQNPYYLEPERFLAELHGRERRSTSAG